MGRNRIAKYLREMDATMAKVVIVTDMLNQRVVLSINGELLTWRWQEGGLVCPGATAPLAIHPLAAETIIDSEIEEFLAMEGVGRSEVIYINTDGSKLDGAYMHPLILGEPTYKAIYAKEALKALYAKYREQGCKLTEGLIGESISFGALGPFLSLINLQG